MPDLQGRLGRLVKQILNLFVVAALVVLFVWLGSAGYTWYSLESYQPPPEVASLAADLRLTNKGRELFYLADPQLHEVAELERQCQSGHNPQYHTFGCYYQGKIHLLKIDSPYFTGRMSVTAAHEILHSAWQEMSVGERSQVKSWLVTLDTSRDAELTRALEPYGNLPPEQFYNEMHSIAGTQLEELPQELETYYGQYFDDRQLIVAFYLQHQANYDKLLEYVAQIENLRTQINELDDQIDAKYAQVQASSERLEALKSDPVRYNQSVSQHNALVTEYKEIVSQRRAEHQVHNKLVREHNQLVDKLSIIDPSLHLEEESDLEDPLD